MLEIIVVPPYFATKGGIIYDDKEVDRVSFIKSYSKMIKPYCAPL